MRAEPREDCFFLFQQKCVAKQFTSQHSAEPYQKLQGWSTQRQHECRLVLKGESCSWLHPAVCFPHLPGASSSVCVVEWHIGSEDFS